jgi:hypothetical protein
MWNHNSESRKERALYQKLYLIETIPSTQELEKEFVVMGSTGNVYTVKICSEPSCTCPDFLRRQRNCKHIFFILLKVMKIDEVDQEYFEDDELREMFSNIPKITSNLIVDKTLRKLYKKQNGDNSEDEEEQEKESKEEDSKVARKPIDDPCPICLEELKENEEDLDYCKYGCGKSIHSKCFFMWSKINKETCVFCRASWIKIDDENKEIIGKNRAMSSINNIYNAYRGNYVNLFDIQYTESQSQLQSAINNINSTGSSRLSTCTRQVNYFISKSYENDNEQDEEDEEMYVEEEESNIRTRRKSSMSKSRRVSNKKNTRKQIKSVVKKPKSAYAFYEAQQLERLDKRNDPISASSKNRKIEEIKDKWRKLTGKQKMKYDVIASKDRERYKREKNGDFAEKNQRNKKRGRVKEVEKNIENSDKRGKTKSRGRKIINRPDKDDEN